MVASGQFGVNRICQLTGISKATYYASRNPINRFESKYAHIKASVAKITAKNSAYGIRPIKAELNDTYHITVGKNALGRLLQIWGLDLKRKVKRTPPNMIQKILISLAQRANLLIRTEITAPFEALNSDITKRT